MKNIAKVIKKDVYIEEEVLVSINSVRFVAFVTYLRYPISIGQEYSVEINFFADDINLQESKDNKKELVRKANTFQYSVTGYLNKRGQLDIGFIVEDELFEDYEYLYGKYGTFNVQRINVDFL